MLSRKNKQDRISFAKKFHQMGLLEEENHEKFAKPILFTDEKYFYLAHKPNGQNYRFRGDISTIIPQQAPKFDSKVLICAGFSFRGVTPIKFLDSTVNATNYTNDILPFYRENFFRRASGNGILSNEMFDGDGCFFQQDGAPPHTARISLAFIRENFPDFFDDWPGNSPDLNPIENLWAIVQEKVDHYPFCISIAELKSRIETAWRQIDPSHHKS